MIIEVDPEHPSHYRINRLVELLEDGGVLAIPTDTCYALACLPQKRSAVDQLVSQSEEGFGVGRAQAGAGVLIGHTDPITSTRP